MLAANKVKMSGSEKKSEQKQSNKIFCEQSSFIKRVTRKFRVVVVQNNGTEMYKKVFCELFFLLIGPFFPVLVAVQFSMTRFSFLVKL